MLPFLLKHCSAHETPTARSAVIIVGRTVKQRSSIELAGELVQKSPCAIVILGFHKLMLFAVLNSLVLFVMCISDSEISPSGFMNKELSISSFSESARASTNGCLRSPPQLLPI